MTKMSPLSRRSRLLVAVGLLASSALLAQSSVTRIHSDIATSETTILQGSRHPLANPQNDAGRVPADKRLNGVTLYFSRSAVQQADLDALLAAQQDQASPQYHKWLTPEQFGARFGMAQPDIDKVQAWLERQGFSIDSVMRSRTGIRFSGSVAQVESAFQTEMHYYTLKGEKHFAPASDLSVPSAMAGVVSGVRNLDDFRPKAQHIVSHHNFTSGSTGNVYFSPGDIVTAYDIKPLYTAGVDGAGQTIAIMGQSWVDLADIEAFQSAAGLAKKDPNLVIVPGTGNDGIASQGDESESDLDLEWSGSMAPGANVVFVYTGDNSNYGVYDSAQYAVDNQIGNIISLSYSSCETDLDSANLTTLEGIFSQAAAQGQTVMAASGDQGSTACYGDTSLTAAQQGAVVVNYPASSAYVTGVGGTEAPAADIEGGSSFSTYWNSSSSDITNSLIKYMPEIAWNDDTYNVDNGCVSPDNCLSASGGGASTLVTQPSWQKSYFTATGEANPSSGHRLVPDISFYSSPDAPGYLYCSSDQSSWDTADGQVASCNSGFRDSTSGLLTVAGGTSFATPIFAGMVALLNENAKYVEGSGEINKTLYSLASGSSTKAAFQDVTSGNNDCLVSWNCTQTTGFSAKTGYDLVTGLGSVDLNELAGKWPINPTGASLIATITTVVPASGTVAANTNDVVTISVSGATGSTPTGNVTLQIDGGTAFGGTTLTDQALTSNGTVTYTANFSTSGTHQVVAQYPGDATHAASTGVGEVVISGGGSGKGTIKLAAANISTAQGSTGSGTITVTPASGYTGTVLLNIDFGASDSTLGNLCYSFTDMDNNGNGTVQVTGTSAVTTTLSLDTNASDCASSSSGIKKPGTHPMMRFKTGATHAGNPPKGNLPAGLAFAGLLLAGFLGRHSRKLRNLACVFALIAIGFAVSACGSSGGGGNNDPPKGTYTGTVTGTDSTTSTITGNATFTFTIN